MPTLDIFKQDAFGVISLTDAINNIKFKPGYLSSIGLFTETGVSTLTVSIEEKDGILDLVAPSPRGAVGETEGSTLRRVRPFTIPHFQRNDAILADQVQGVRAFGQESATETVQGLVSERMAIHVDAMELTVENARLGAVKGVITYKDNSTVNLFTEFEVSQEAEIDFDLDNANPASGALRKKCAEVHRKVATILDGTPYTGLTALCGDTFYDQVVAHPEVRATYANWPAAAELRRGYVSAGGAVWDQYPFGGIMFVNYRGYGATAVEATKAHIFPTGVPNLFRTYWAPADYVETVNTIGQRLYAKQEPKKFDKGIDLEVQMNGLHICTRPRVLIKAKNT